MARTTNAVMMSLGTVNMWGFSPGFDMQQTCLHRQAADHETHEPLNALLVGPGDIRHALNTIASRRRHGDGKRPIHIYIYENSVETLARHLLLLQIAQDWELPLRQRCNTFLEVFGNALVQERTSAYIEAKAKALVQVLHHERGWLADQIDLSHLKMKTRDEMVDTFQSWYQKVSFDMVKLRDHRLRHFYDVRYDYRNNLIDWDYTMTLRKIEHASVIHLKQYREWRNSGIAFEFGDQQYTQPNRSMAAYTEARKKNHGAVLCRGLWTDIVVGPYVAFGVQCDTPNKFAKQLFEIHNKGTGVEQNRHNTTEVAVYNVLSHLYELETGEIYRMKKAHDVYSGVGDSELGDSDNQESKEMVRIEELDDGDKQELGEDDVAAANNQGLLSESEQLQAQAKERDAQQRAKTIVESFDGIKIIPLTGKLDDMYTKKRYEHVFDHVFLSSQHCHTLQKSDAAKDETTFTNLLRPQATVSIESPMFLLPLTEDQRVLYVTKMLEMTQSHALKPAFSCAKSPSKEDLLQIENAVLRFSFERS